jgi:hypothetical protein
MRTKKSVKEFLLHSVQNILYSRLLPKRVKIRTHRNIILLVLFDGYETWSVILRDGHKFRVFEIKVMRKIFRS